MSGRQIVYACLAAVGMAATWYYNIQFMQEHGGEFSVSAFIAGGYANAAAGSLSNDVMVAAVTFLVWMFAEARRLGMRHAWVYLLVTFGVALACAFPLFLLMRERRMEALAQES